MRCFAAILIAGLLTEGSVAATAKSAEDLYIITVSARPDTVSGGDVLVRINVPPGVAINDLIVLLNGQNITGAFRPEAGRHSLLGLVDGLTVGQNSLLAKAVDANNVTYRSASLSLTNYPIAGPIPRHISTLPFPAVPAGQRRGRSTSISGPPPRVTRRPDDNALDLLS